MLQVDLTPPPKQNKKRMYVFTRVLTYHHFFPMNFFSFSQQLRSLLFRLLPLDMEE